ncbi:MAG: class C beta-lactamase-related serine hydrolase [Chitinophagaceae bacterium]|nr:MAG: class C beta-lactamase-related serine hydrolase [Chitinophagaceae bacterium]
MKRLLIFALAGLASCIKQEDIKTPTEATPVSRNDGWQVSTPAAEGINQDKLKTAYALFNSQTEMPLANSLLVIRHGKLVAESYNGGADGIDRIENVQSCTKSITSLLIGIALQKGLISNINTPLSTIYPEFVPDDNQKKSITIKHCLTMETGLEFDGGASSKALVETKGSSISFIMDKPLVSAPGSKFLYSDYSPHLLSGVIAKESGTSMEAFASANLFQPLGIDKWVWEKAKDGLQFGGFSLFLTPRNLAKLGQFALNGGRWNNTQICQAGWVASATQQQASNPGYGYLFWLDPSKNSYLMEGNGGQYVFVCPAKQLIIVYTAFPYSSPELWGQSKRLIDLVYEAAQ